MTQRPAQARPAYSSPTAPAPFGGAFPPGERAGSPYPHNGHDHDHYHDSRRPYSYSGGIYAVPGWISPGFGDYSDPGYGYGDNYADSGAANVGPPAPENASGGAVDAPYEQQYAAPPSRPAYATEAPPVTTAPPAPPADQPETTLVFKDGRAPQQVQSYAVTQTTLYVLDGARRREIPLSQIDLPATQQTNLEAGVDFNVPAGAR